MQNDDIIARVFNNLCDTAMKKVKNPVISPYSILNIVALIRKSVCGELASEIDEVLGPNFVQDVEKLYGWLIQQIPMENSVFPPFIPRSTCPENISKIPEDKRRMSKRGRKKASKANESACDKTQESVINFVTDPLPIDSLTFLTNITNFKEAWTNKFSKKNISNHIFTNIDGTETSIPFMSGNQNGEYEKTNMYELCKIPFLNCFITFIIPNAGINIPIETIIKKCKTCRIAASTDVKIPFLNIEYETENLHEILREIGITKIFKHTNISSNWTSLVNASEKNNNNFISKITHKVVLKINQKGTEGTEITSRHAVDGDWSQINIFNCNKPFFYAITDAPTSQILFLGLKTNF